MPIVIKDFNWKQSETHIVIKIPLHGVNPSKVEIFSSPRYIKASYAPYFFEAVLFDTIDVSQSTCLKSPKEIQFELRKSKDALWETLEVTSITKQEKNELKRNLIEENHKHTREQVEAKINKKAELKRIAVREQIDLDTRTRKAIEDKKKTEETNALGDINEWKKSIEAPIKTTIKEEPVKIPIRQTTKRQAKVKSTPKPRSTRSLQILFTPREFPTPSRESKLEEENEFLRKQAAARRSAGFVDEDLRPEEKNPQFLLAKSKEFAKNNNFLGAISALSFAIKISSKFVDLYIARSEMHLAVGNYNSAAEDCSTALDLLKPALPINAEERANCIGNRGFALFKLGFMREGIGELQASLKLNRNSKFETVLDDCLREFEEIKEKEQNEKKKKEQERGT